MSHLKFSLPFFDVTLDGWLRRTKILIKIEFTIRITTKVKIALAKSTKKYDASNVMCEK